MRKLLHHCEAVGKVRMPVKPSQGADRKIQMKESPGFHFTISLAPMLPLQDLFSDFEALISVLFKTHFIVLLISNYTKYIIFNSNEYFDL